MKIVPAKIPAPSQRTLVLFNNPNPSTIPRTIQSFGFPSPEGTDSRRIIFKKKYAEVINEHKKWLPKNDALPAGETDWKGDKLDKRVKDWITNDSIPVWLR